MPKVKIVGGYNSTPLKPAEAAQGKTISKSGSSLPPEPISLKAQRAAKADELRAQLRPEIAAHPIATENVQLAVVLSSIVDSFEQSTAVPPYSTISNDQLEHRGLTEPVRDTFGRMGSKPSAAILAAGAKHKAQVSQKAQKLGGGFNAALGNLIGARGQTSTSAQKSDQTQSHLGSLLGIRGR